MIRFVRNSNGELVVKKDWESKCSVKFVHKSVTDLSHWSPDLESTKHLQLALSGTSNNLQYDYQDGVDNGSSLYLLRRRDLDITERDALLNQVFERNLEKSTEELKEVTDKLEKQAKESEISSASSSPAQASE